MGYFGIPFRNGVPIGLGSVASFGAQQFDPSSLFIGGTAGTWYDPSDPTTLFTTSTGTTPCAVPGSGSQVLVGLMLDKSQGAPGALGAELVTNGTFAIDADWTKGTGWTISGGSANYNGTGNNALTQAGVFTSGKTYLITFDITVTSGGVNLWINGTQLVQANINTNGSRTFRFFATTSGSMYFESVAGASVLSLDNISVREIPGNHAIAFNDTTARPELSARVNLLTYSEQFDNAAWSKITSGTGSIPAVTPNAGTAPDGTNTADLVVFNRGAGNTISDYSWMYQATGATLTAGVSYIGGIYAKAATSGDVGKTLILRHVAGADITITLTADWQLVSGAQTAAGVSSSLDIINRGTTGNSVSVLLWGADLRPANIGSAIPPYQRIADQYTYDSNGFPTYLRFDGVDDSMYTPASINFSGTDKMSVFAGVRKLSDAAQGIFCELSSSTTSNNGTFRMTFPGGAGAASYAWLSKGTLQASITGNLLAAPITNVVTGIGDIGNDDCTVRINGPAQVNQSTADQGTGNYGTYPLYIGSRANTSLFFNGYLYSLITAGTQLQSGSITATEQYVAGKTGVQI